MREPFLLAITELEIIKINIEDCAVLGEYALPDFYKSIEFKFGYAIVKSVNDEYRKVPL